MKKNSGVRIDLSSAQLRSIMPCVKGEESTVIHCDAEKKSLDATDQSLIDTVNVHVRRQYPIWQLGQGTDVRSKRSAFAPVHASRLDMQETMSSWF